MTWYVNDVRLSDRGNPVSIALEADRFLPERFEVKAVVKDMNPLAGPSGLQREIRWAVIRSDFAMVPRGSTFDASPLGQNYPNPVSANASTTIDFKLTGPRFVTLRIFDLAGREVATVVQRELDEGTHAATWEAAVAPGVYMYTLETGRATERRKLVVTR